MNPLDMVTSNLLDDEVSASKRLAEDKYRTRLVMTKIRDEWLRDKMLERESEFTVRVPLSMYVGTWNVNGKKPSESLNSWVCVHETPPDVIVCGFQEIVELTAGNVVLSDNNTKERCTLWVEALASTLRRSYTNCHYKIMCERHLVGVMICVFVKNDHAPFVNKHSIKYTEVATGVMGMGNKGGCVVRFQIYDSTFCVVCAHLAAHRENVEARNADFKSIMERAGFTDDAMSMAKRNAVERLSVPADSSMLVPRGVLAYRSSSAAASDDDLRQGSLSLASALSNPSFGIEEHDFIFWLGDFNYRIRSDHTIDTVMHNVNIGNIEWLLENDQLFIEQAGRRAFHGFQEAPIKFLPTYKFQVGTTQYDRRPDKKIRAPAYCDRILWRSSLDNSAIVNLKYRAVMSMLISDHKPVYALFEVQATKVLHDSRSTVFSEIHRDLDRWENDSLPQVEMSKSTLSFPKMLEYMEMQQTSVVITNTGNVPVAWRFVPKTEDLSLCKPWLRLKPDYGLITPGNSVEIVVTAKVNAIIAAEVAKGLENLDDILILRLENGRDHFIPVSANLTPTCFGMTLSSLVRIHYPCSVPLEEKERIIKARLHKFGDKSKTPLSIPKELWWMFNFLYTNQSLDVPYLFRDSQRNSSLESIQAVRRCINYGTEIPHDTKPHAVAAVILEFLDALPEPVVPASLFPTADINNISLELWGRRFLEQLPPLRHNVFVYVITFLREMLNHSQHNHLNVDGMAFVFAPSLMRPGEVIKAQQKEKRSMPFELPGWFSSSEKPESSLSSIAEKVIAHFLQVDKGYFYN